MKTIDQFSKNEVIESLASFVENHSRYSISDDNRKKANEKAKHMLSHYLSIAETLDQSTDFGYRIVYSANHAVNVYRNVFC